MAESKGRENEFRRVTRGAAVATEAINMPERENVSSSPTLPGFPTTPDLYGTVTTSKSIRVNATFGHVALARRLDQFFKRALEIVAAAVMLLCLAPILLITSVAISLDSGGPVFVRETRRDYRNRAIQVFKFRITACVGGDCSSRRLTRIGLILSQTGIDELPQLVNVLTGKISLIETVKSLL